MKTYLYKSKKSKIETLHRIIEKKMNFAMCMHYVNKLLTLVYKIYERKPIQEESHWGQWSIIDE
jgi:hypothetical protein